MSPPRRPFGPDQPGRLQATMLKVLAAEMSDPGRFTRGKRLRADDAVVDLVIGHGAATAVVQGSRPEPYVVTLLTRAGRSVPSRRDVTVRCTCPDDDGVGSDACKHGVAALFALADEVSLDLDGAGEVAPDRHRSTTEQATTATVRRRRRRAGGDAEADPPPSVDPLVAELTGLLRPPERRSDFPRCRS